MVRNVAVVGQREAKVVLLAEVAVEVVQQRAEAGAKVEAEVDRPEVAVDRPEAAVAQREVAVDQVK